MFNSSTKPGCPLFPNAVQGSGIPVSHTCQYVSLVARRFHVIQERFHLIKLGRARRPPILPHSYRVREHPNYPAPRVSFSTDGKVESEDVFRPGVCSAPDAVLLTLIEQLRATGVLSASAVMGELTNRFGGDLLENACHVYDLTHDSDLEAEQMDKMLQDIDVPRKAPCQIPFLRFQLQLPILLQLLILRPLARRPIPAMNPLRREGFPLGELQPMRFMFRVLWWRGGHSATNTQSVYLRYRESKSSYSWVGGGR